MCAAVGVMPLTVMLPVTSPVAMLTVRSACAEPCESIGGFSSMPLAVTAYCLTLATVAVTSPERPMLPAASSASADSTWSPSVSAPVSQSKLYGDVVSLPSRVPSA